MKVKILFIGAFFLFPLLCQASVFLKKENNRPYEQSIYEHGLSLSLKNAVPDDAQSFSIFKENEKIGSFIAGYGLNDRDTKICFVSWAVSSGSIDKMFLTVGDGEWEAEVCNKTIAVGILSKASEPIIKIGVIYDAQSPNTNLTESIIFSLNPSVHSLGLDEDTTRKIGSEGAANFKELKVLYKKLVDEKRY